MLVDREGLWFRVLVARYGLEHGRLREGGRGGSAWWREIVRIRDGVGGLRDGWFGESVTRRVGDGSDTFFCSDPWLGGISLCERFGRLYDLAASKSRTVAEMCAAGWEEGGGRGSGGDIYGRGRHVPLKVSILAWRLLRDQLPTRANLVSRGILAPDLQDCVTCCGGIETTRHLFLSCSTFGSLWALVRYWIGFSAVDAFSLSNHFVQFTYSTGGLRARRSFLQLVWLACVWVVWSERNHRIFRNSEHIVHQLLDKVKLFSYRWMRTTDVTLATNSHCWWSSPLLCLGID
ncbi:hypothetical protein QL285_057836 [Trifolium repens]|nr:hypothetical protein QL285_057836 [Trifolium repens]